jgi:hypothetical protein
LSDFLNKQIVKGNLLDLGFSPDVQELKISLNERLALYKNETQIPGDQRLVAVDQFGDWETELLDTDNMAGEIYYIFEINRRLYKKLVPISQFAQDFTSLPNFIK